MKKRLRVTSYFASLLLAGSVHTYAKTQVKLQLNFNNATLIEVLDAIETQSGFNFLIQIDDIDTRQRVSVNSADDSLESVLSKVLDKFSLSYEIRDKHVVIIPRERDDKQAKERVSEAKKQVSGTIKDQSGEPIIGANISIKGTDEGTISDLDGAFVLGLSAGNVIEVSYIGYVTQHIVYKAQSKLDVVLSEDTKNLEEVVVIGYGTMKKKDLTGSVGSVKGSVLVEQQSTQLSNALQGTVPGVLVSRSNGAPGSTSSIKVRGITTIGDSNPLIIVDGVAVSSIDQVNPNDVENISVLKDAASASIYGARAAAGVVVITTKRAKQDELFLNYNFEYGFDKPTQMPKFVDITRYLQMTNELRWNDAGNGENQYPTYSKDIVDDYINLNKSDPDKYPITNWQDLILKQSAPRQRHALSISAGSKVVKTNVSLGYDRADGLTENRYYERITARANNDFTINKYVGASFDMNFKRSKSHQPHYDPIHRMRVAAPVYAATWSDGRIAEGKSGANPYGMMKEGGTSDSWYNQVGGKIGLDVKPIDGLKISGIIAPIYNFDKTKSHRKKIPYYSASDPNEFVGYLEGYATTKLTEGRNDDYSVTYQAIANYNKQLKESHDLNFMAGYESYYAYNETLSASRDKYELDNYPYLDLGPMEMRDNGGRAWETAYQSWFGRAMYSYKNKYLLQANVRYDGSSRFHNKYRWGAFPSFSGGWVITEENFLKPTDFLSFLKVRASWGALGNERIGNYPYQSTIVFGNTLFYQNGDVISQLTAAQQRYVIESISWEKTESFDIGIDANFFDNRLRFTGDYYIKTTKDMLLSLEIPDYIGFDNPDQNTGRMNTKGFELQLDWNDQIGDVRYGVSANLSDFKSKMGDLGGTEFLGDQVKKKGSEFNEWYGYLSDGLFQTAEEVSQSPVLNKNVKPGDVKYKDVSGPDGVPDGKISPDYDRVLLGGSMPRFLYGGRLSVGYKGLDLSMTFQGVGKQNSRISTMMMQPLMENWGNVPALIDGNYWSMYNSTEENMSARYPRLSYAQASTNYAMSDYWLFNGRYFRLKNITLSYVIPKAFTEKMMVKQLRFYVSANDLFSIDKYPQGWDPEMGASAYPITRSFLFGLSVNF